MGRPIHNCIFSLALLCFAANVYPQSPADLLTRAQTLESRGQHDEAIIAYRDYLRARPEDDEPRAKLARLLSWQGQFAAAVALYRDILSRHPADVDVQVALAGVLSWRKDFAESRALYEKILNNDPKNVEARRGFADTLFWSGDHVQALRLYEDLLTETNDPEIRKQIAAVRTEINQRRRAPVGPPEKTPMLPYRDYLKFGYDHYTFTNDRLDERGWLLEVSKPLGDRTVVARVEILNRFGMHDAPFSGEFYSPLWNQAWGYVGLGFAVSPNFSSKINLSGEIAQGLGALHPGLSFLEPSFGFRWVSFAKSKVEILVPGITIYFPRAVWLTEKVYYVPDTNAATLQSELTWQPSERLRLFVSGSFGKSAERFGVAEEFAKIHSWTVRSGVTFPITERFSAEIVGLYEDRKDLYVRRGGTFNLIYHW